MSFAWPLLLPATSALESGYLAIIASFALSFMAAWIFDRSVFAVNYLALLGSLAALGAATRIATSGVGGFELVFLIVILGGAALGPSFGFQLGALTVVLSSLFFGGLGPWTPFQLFAICRQTKFHPGQKGRCACWLCGLGVVSIRTRDEPVVLALLGRPRELDCLFADCRSLTKSRQFSALYPHHLHPELG